MEYTKEEPKDTKWACPFCGKPLKLFKSKFETADGSQGYWLGCTGYPECHYHKSADAEGNPVDKPAYTGGSKTGGTKSFGTPIGEACPKCGQKTLVERTSKTGSKYRKCTNKSCGVVLFRNRKTGEWFVPTPRQ